MPVCKYYLQGNCKFGDQCRYDHVDPKGNNNNNMGMSDPFSPHSNNRRSGGGNQRKKTNVRDTPQWPLTCVGAHPLSSGNTITGDMSPEELRVLAYASAPPMGISAENVQREANLVAEYQQQNNSSSGGGRGGGNQGGGMQHRQEQQPVGPRDPFAGQTQQQSSSQLGNSQQSHQQTPIFGQPQTNPSQPQTQQPIFGHTQQQQAGFGFNQASQSTSLQTSQPEPSPIFQPAAAQPMPVAQETQAQPQFAYQQVPETAPPANFH